MKEVTKSNRNKLKKNEWVYLKEICMLHFIKSTGK